MKKDKKQTSITSLKKLIIRVLTMSEGSYGIFLSDGSVAKELPDQRIGKYHRGVRVGEC